MALSRPPRNEAEFRRTPSLPQVSAEKLDIDDKASPAVFGFYVNANALAKATLTGVWGR